MAAKIKKGDTVVVLTGRDKGKEGEVLSVRPKDNKVVVQGVAMAKRHQRPSQTSQGGIVEQEMAIDISNVALLDPKDKKPTRVGFKVLNDGRKVRVSKRSGEEIGA
ncbi:50S ribosomal protein L24 [Marivibrio halodurans]|uniref:Large ribosomal subunit protein uL24 n=2 Tax=Marivibrio halodurans TaxID=2039722 RepID=A0A8J7V402_9PROT|nr:50S ribosomal protein L24 [Marivibrio halodurans]MBP5857164.1 50S ribosomal protein L24 [Marivibrio halodurans]